MKKSNGQCNYCNGRVRTDEDFKNDMIKLHPNVDILSKYKNSTSDLKCKCKVCNTNYYKLIILDVLMPVMDGIQAVKTIQEMIDTQKINQETNVVLLSAHIDDN